MTREEVNAMLTGYKRARSRKITLDAVMAEERRALDEMRRTALAEAATAGGLDMDGMPRGTDVRSRVETIAVRFADGYQPDYIAAAERRLAEHERELRQVALSVVLVDGWMECLTDRERFVIKAKELDGMYWREIIAAYNEKYKEAYSKSGLTRVRERALEKIYDVAA